MSVQIGSINAFYSIVPYKNFVFTTSMKSIQKYFSCNDIVNFNGPGEFMWNNSWLPTKKSCVICNWVPEKDQIDDY